MNNPVGNIAIKNPNRVLHIFNKICDSKLPVLMKEQKSNSLAVRGTAVCIQKSNTHEMVINQISKKGIQFLFNKENIVLEFIMLSLKIHCTCPIIQVHDEQVIIGLPKALFSTEKRKNSRYKTNENSLSFISLDCFPPDENDFLATPFFEVHKNLATYLPIDNISTDGVCFTSQFPSVFTKLEKKTFNNCYLILPMTPPIKVEPHIRWIKSIKKPINNINPEIKITNYLAGCQFENLNTDSIHHIKKYIQILISSGAV